MKPLKTSELAKLCKECPFGSQDDKKNPLVIARLIARSSGTIVFYLIDYDRKKKVAQAYVCGYDNFQDNGWDLVDVAELAETHSCECCEAKISFLLDSSFKPKPLSQCLEEADDWTQALPERTINT